MNIRYLIEQLEAKRDELDQQARDEQSCYCCPNPTQDRYEYQSEGIDLALEIINDWVRQREEG